MSPWIIPNFLSFFCSRVTWLFFGISIEMPTQYNGVANPWSSTSGRSSSPAQGPLALPLYRFAFFLPQLGHLAFSPFSTPQWISLNLPPGPADGLSQGSLHLGQGSIVYTLESPNTLGIQQAGESQQYRPHPCARIPRFRQQPHKRTAPPDR